MPGRVDPQHPGADRPAQPLLARAGIEGAAERAARRGDRADALRAVEQDRHVQLAPAPSARSAPVTQLTCEQATSLVRGPTASARSANGTARTSTPRRARSVQQRAEQPGVLVGRGEHLVARSEPQAGEHAHDAVARARGERDVAASAPSAPA